MIKETDVDRPMDSYVIPRPQDMEREDPESVRAMKSGYEIDDF